MTTTTTQKPVTKALTICQPYASLIALPPTDRRAKRVENRTWAPPARLQGERIAIHAGGSRSWLRLSDDGLSDRDYAFVIADLPFKVIVATAVLADWFQPPAGPTLLQRCPWLKSHRHVDARSPWCWILTDVQTLADPIPCRGAQKLWEIPELEQARLAEAQIRQYDP